MTERPPSMAGCLGSHRDFSVKANNKRKKVGIC